MPRGIKNTKDIIIKEYKRNIISPLIYKTSFEVNTNFEEKDTIIRDYNNGGKPITIKSRNYKFGDFVMLTIKGFSIAGRLTPKAYKLLEYVLNNVKVNSNFVEFDTEFCKSFIGVKTDSAYYKARSELVDFEFIAPSKEHGKDVYVINHNLFFKGRRNDFIFDYDHVYSVPEEGVIMI